MAALAIFFVGLVKNPLSPIIKSLKESESNDVDVGEERVNGLILVFGRPTCFTICSGTASIFASSSIRTASRMTRCFFVVFFLTLSGDDNGEEEGAACCGVVH